MNTPTTDNPATPHSTLVEDGQAFYESRLKSTLELEHIGEFVAVEPSAARYFLGHTATDALVAARNAMPESKFFLIRIGSRVAHKIGGHGARIR